MNIGGKCWNSMNLPPEERISKKAFKSNSTACVAWEINLDNSKNKRDVFTYTNTRSRLHPSTHIVCILSYVMFKWRAALCFPKCAVAGVNLGLPLSATAHLSNLQIWQTRGMISKWPGQQQQQHQQEQQQRSVGVRGACNQKVWLASAGIFHHWHFPQTLTSSTTRDHPNGCWMGLTVRAPARTH